jgi:hypothetical protein
MTAFATTFMAVSRLAGVLAAGLFVTSGLVGCGSSETQAACTKVQGQLSSVLSQGVTNAKDPKKLEEIYVDGAAKMREFAKGTDIVDETDAVAAALQKLGHQVSEFVANPSAGMPDLSSPELTKAGAALQKACS